MQNALLGKTPAALTALARALGMPAYRGAQLAEWLYRRHARSLDEMTNLSKRDRALLAAEWTPGHVAPTTRLESADGTLKYAFPVGAAGAARAAGRKGAAAAGAAAGRGGGATAATGNAGRRGPAPVTRRGRSWSPR